MSFNNPVIISIIFVSITYILIGLTFNNKSLGIGLAILGIVLSIITPYISLNLYGATQEKQNGDIGGGVFSSSSTISMVLTMSIILILVKFNMDSSITNIVTNPQPV